MQDHLRPNKETTYFASYIRFIIQTPRIPELEWGRSYMDLYAMGWWAKAKFD